MLLELCEIICAVPDKLQDGDGALDKYFEKAEELQDRHMYQAKTSYSTLLDVRMEIVRAKILHKGNDVNKALKAVEKASQILKRMGYEKHHLYAYTKLLYSQICQPESSLKVIEDLKLASEIFRKSFDDDAYIHIYECEEMFGRLITDDKESHVIHNK